MAFVVQTVINGILVGGIYACVAIGLSLAYGVMRIFNWANGDMFMASLYMAVLFTRASGVHPYLTIFVVAPIMAVAGFLIQKFLLNPLIVREKDREPLSVLLTTAGISFILANMAVLIFGNYSLSVTADYPSRMIRLGGDILIADTKVIAFAAVVCTTLALELIMRKTNFGLALRATSQDREVAALMGMNNSFLYCAAFAIGMACLGIASGVMAPMYSVSPSVGTTFGFKCMIIVVLGGKGSIPGALLGGVIIGLVESFVGTLASDIMAQMVIFIVFAAVLLFKPNGLLSKDRG